MDSLFNADHDLWSLNELILHPPFIHTSCSRCSSSCSGPCPPDPTPRWRWGGCPGETRSSAPRHGHCSESGMFLTGQSLGVRWILNNFINSLTSSKPNTIVIVRPPDTPAVVIRIVSASSIGWGATEVYCASITIVATSVSLISVAEMSNILVLTQPNFCVYFYLL